MKYDEFVDAVADLPLIDAGVLAALGRDPASLAVQLSRWVAAGRLVRLGRGRYVLPARRRRHAWSPELAANLLRTPSYVSLERALSIHGLIPEAVPLVQSVTTGRPGLVTTPLGDFDYRHVKRSWFTGYRELPLGRDRALVATPEKALLDLVYLSRGEFTAARIAELRLGDLDSLDPTALRELARLSGKPRVVRAARRILDLASTTVREDSP
ncbi:MAG: type IV toxin-antitoxin system AbiEi family antitoxin domain-containing protein [Deltaproteobacteria bacterium]|nr:type IV toxin-antitoxin system AbiEi family antitoxin domain-containing protein [Deltaproteobacteria bacterium]